MSKNSRMLLSAFTIFHVILSLAGIASGFVVLYGLLNSDRMDGWTSLFLITTVATTVTGFLFPFHGITPAINVGIVSLIVLAIAIAARYRFGMAGGWGKTYVITAVVSLYLNFFVLIAQLFQKVPSLKALAPAGSEPPFLIAQITALLIFVVLGIMATRRFSH